MTVSCVGDVRAGVWTGTVVGIDVTIVTRVGVMVVGVFIDLFTDITIGFVTRIGVDVFAGVDTNMVAAATDPGFIDTRVSLEDALRCC